MKKLLHLLLSGALLCTLVLPGTAATDQRLTQVTLAVKEALDIDTHYDTFYGELEENTYQTFWSLNWEGEGRSLRISADEDGTIYRYSLSRYEDEEEDSSKLPALSRTQARQAAEDFLGQVLSAPEGALEDTSWESGTSSSGGNREQYHFYGVLTLYGLPTPVTYSVSLDSNTGEILQYRRDDRYECYVGTPASPEGLTQAGQEQATALLRDTLALRLEYVLDDTGEQAVLRYLPQPWDRYYVDAATGELVNLTQLSRDMVENGEDGATSGSGGSESAPDNGLTDAELEGILQMKDVQDPTALDTRVRTYSALGLEDYTLTQCHYSLNRDSGQVTASLSYRQTTGDTFRSVTVDAKTGELLSVYGPTWKNEGFSPSVTAERAQATAEAFLSQLWGEQFAQTALYDSAPIEEEGYRRAHQFTYAQQVNGYFFPQNTITISVDGETGTIATLSRSFDCNPRFDSPDGLISPEQALTAWQNTYIVQTGYTRVPQDLSHLGSQYPALVDLGYSYIYALKLGYTIAQQESYRGVDAKTGEPIPQPADMDGSAVFYDDLEGHWVEDMALALADYGIGWLGGSLEPTRPLTQLDGLALLLSTRGNLIDLSQEGAADQVYDRAYAYGLLSPEAREDGRILTRGELVALLLDSAGYGPAAQIPRIFHCTFLDEAAIPAHLYGYAAIAQGLGMVTGDGSGCFAAHTPATRMEAIAMVYRLMTR